MALFTCDPDLLLVGQTARSLLENVNRDVMQPYLEQHGIVDIDPEGWYPAQSVLDVMNDLAQRGNTTSDFVAIGVKAAELSPLTPQLEQLPFDEFMGVYADIFRTRHRNGNPGSILVEVLEEGHVQLVMDVVYPDDVMYGLIYGYARRLIRSGQHFTVYYDDQITPRDAGGEETIIHVTWGH